MLVFHHLVCSAVNDTDRVTASKSRSAPITVVQERRGGARAVAFGASRYHVLLTFGASYSVGAQRASVSVVLPFLLAEKGIYWAAVAITAF